MQTKLAKRRLRLSISELYIYIKIPPPYMGTREKSIKSTAKGFEKRRP
jgi:hypothetical protein